MSNSTNSFIHLRILVLALGESQHAGWWDSQFLSSIGLSFLERVYPRSKFAAAVRSATRAARGIHDANVGKGTVFHLFRLTRQQERAMDELLTAQSRELEALFQPILANEAELTGMLGAMTGHKTAPGAVGPVQIGAEDRFPQLAANYLQAFRDGTQVFPYFDELSGAMHFRSASHLKGAF
ncbi:MAG: BrxE family protein [Anaerolineales bacterium]